jgi:hypothetical protein
MPAFYKTQKAVTTNRKKKNQTPDIITKKKGFCSLRSPFFYAFYQKYGIWYKMIIIKIQDKQYTIYQQTISYLFFNRKKFKK